jgi:polyether ionophore transport system permease protein
MASQSLAMCERASSWTVARRTARRAARSAVIWGLLFGGLVANEALSYRAGFPDRTSRAAFARTMGDNRGLTAVTGPARQLDTLDGFVAWRMVSLMLVAGAIWGLLTATRLMRGEEDAGRWDLLLAGRTSRRRAAGQAVAGLAVAWSVLWALTAAGTLAAGLQPRVGFSVGDSLLYATTGTASAAVFLAVGALTSQLGASRRRANALAAAVFASAWILRMLADGRVLPGWVRWTTPLGWVENVAPLTDPNPWALLPVAGLTIGAAVAAVRLAGRRDVGQGLLARAGPPRRRRMPTGQLGLTVRLERWPALAWALGLGASGFVFGLVARSASEGSFGSESIGSVVGRTSAGEAAAWMGYEYLYLAAILAFAAAAQVSALRAEEDDGHLAHLLARRVSRRAWLGGRLLLGASVVVAAGLAAGLGGWLGVVGRGGLGPTDMLSAAVNVSVPGLFVLGLGAALYGLVPRLASPVLYAFVLWSFLVEIVGSGLHASWLVHTSLLDQLGPVPAAPTRWLTIVAVLAAGAVAAAVGVAAFDRRDLRGS